MGDKEASINFYLNEKDADSSVIQPIKFDTIKKIKVIKLDDYIQKEKIQKIKLLKIEAEGFEPEILEGCEKNINKLFDVTEKLFFDVTEKYFLMSRKNIFWCVGVGIKF